MERITDIRRPQVHSSPRSAQRRNGHVRSSSIEASARLRCRPSVSVVIPTLNEAANLPLVLPYLPMDWIDEVVLVDGRSTDGTVEVAEQLLPSIKVVMETKPGKGAAMWAGYQASRGDVIVMLDADGSHDPREIPRYVEALMQGADLVKGTRFAPGGGTTDMPRFRMLGNAAFVLVANLFFGTSWTDVCYGYHAFWRHCLDVLDLSEVHGFEIDTALYLQAARKQLRVIEVPSFEGYRFHGVGKLQTIPDGFRVLKTIQSEWLQALKGSNGDRYIGFRGYTPSEAACSPTQAAALAPTVVALDSALQLKQAEANSRSRLFGQTALQAQGAEGR